jgi:inner membrane protein
VSFGPEFEQLAFRRGWTHGVLAQALLPVVLTAAFVAVDRWRPPRPGSAPLRTSALLLLGYIGVLSHVAMDWLNNYGVRLLMPFSRRWFYGDSVFIVDPWLWLTLAAGVLLARRAGPERSRRAGRTRMAAIAVVIATAYIGAMVISARAARGYVMASWTARSGSPPVKLMVGPVPITPFRKTVILDAGDVYHRGTFTWFPRRFEIAPDVVPKHDRDPAVLQAQEDPRFRAILVWARFPYYELTRDPDGIRVTIADLRFGPRLFNATTVVRHDGQ